MTVKALYPGTFDPPTNGHIDLIQRGAKLFDHLVVAVLNNPGKNPFFTVEERVEMLHESINGLSNVSVATFDGLMVDFARQQGASAVLRGIRAISDYEYEFQMALMNRRLCQFAHAQGSFQLRRRSDGTGSPQCSEASAQPVQQELTPVLRNSGFRAGT
jgi:pantetheine-phosphate adenylyltransferase